MWGKISLVFIFIPDISSSSRTNVHYLVYHLTIADSITTFITLPMEEVYRALISESEALPFVEIYRDTVPWLVGIVVLLRQLFYAIET